MLSYSNHFSRRPGTLLPVLYSVFSRRAILLSTATEVAWFSDAESTRSRKLGRMIKFAACGFLHVPHATAWTRREPLAMPSVASSELPTKTIVID